MNRLRNPLLTLSVLTLVAGATVADDAFDRTRALLERWVETRKAIATEKRDWKLAKEMLEDRAELGRPGERGSEVGRHPDVEGQAKQQRQHARHPATAAQTNINRPARARARRAAT